jgi:hypothetical protein
MDLQISIIAENSSKFELDHGTNIQDYELDEAELFIAVNFSIGVRYIFLKKIYLFKTITISSF